VDYSLDRIQVIFLGSTRELVINMSSHLEQVGKSLGVRVVPLFGGHPARQQVVEVRRVKPHVIMATPYRLNEIMSGEFGHQQLDATHVKVLMFDEMERSEAMGFNEQIENVVSLVLSRSQYRVQRIVSNNESTDLVKKVFAGNQHDLAPNPYQIVYEPKEEVAKSKIFIH
jgi:superfamily II DNA/RNA helicase